MLHILMHSPYNINYSLFLNFLKKKDDVMLIQDGVIAGLKNTVFSMQIISKKINIFALYYDIYARGIKNKIDKQIKIVRYSKFIKLTTKNINQITW